MTDSPAIDPARLRKLLKRMIDHYSPSGKEEELVDYLAGYLKRHGLKPLKQEVDDNRSNLLVMPAGEKVDLVFVGHVDTVPAHDLDSYEYEAEDGEVLGLGAADMKGGCAAMIEAVVALTRGDGPPPPVALALVVGEEEEGDGARELVREYQFPWAVIGEPTDMRLCPSHYGYLEVQLSSRGERKHASLADRKHHPVTSVLRALMAVTNHIDELKLDIVYNIRDLWSSRAGFAVPDQCEAWVDLHLPPSAPIGDIMADLEELVAVVNENNPGSDAEVRFTTVDTGYELPEKGPVIEALREVFEKHSLAWEPVPFRSHSDASQLWEAGARPVILGPGKLEKAHVPDESVSFGQVVLAANIYMELAKALMDGQDD